MKQSGPVADGELGLSQYKGRTGQTEVLCETQASHRLPVFTSRTVITISPGVYEDRREVHRISLRDGCSEMLIYGYYFTTVVGV